MKTLALLMPLFCLTLWAAEPRPVTNAPLVNQEGKPFQLHDLKGKHVLLSFVFTRCPVPNMCPLTVTKNKALYRQWKKAKGAPELHFLFVTMDPDFDTAKVLKKFAKDRNIDLKHFTLATGNPSVLLSLQAEFQVLALPEKGTISHNMRNVLLGPDMKVLRWYKENEWQAEEVLETILKSASVAVAPPEQ